MALRLSQPHTRTLREPVLANTRRTPQTSTGRLLVERGSRYAAARGLRLGRHSYDWIVTLTGDGRTRLLHRYDLGANTPAAKVDRQQTLRSAI